MAPRPERGGPLPAAALVLVLTGAPALADPIGDGAFHGAYPMAESELSDLRGGFVLPDTLLYFTINAQSQIVDNMTGDIVSDSIQFSFESGLGSVSNLPNSLVLTDNRTAVATSVTDIAGLLTVVQNAQDNVTIQQLTDMTVGLDMEALAVEASGLPALTRQMQTITLMQLP